MDIPARDTERFRKVKNTNQLETYFYPGIFMDDHMNYTWENVTIGHVQVKVHGRHSSQSATYAETGQVLWPASMLLSHYLLHHPDLVQSRSVLELGAGVGLPGLVAAKLTKDPSTVVLTDHTTVVLDLLEKNIAANFTDATDSPKCALLDWGVDLEEFYKTYGTFDLIIGADLIFWTELEGAAEPLFQTVSKLLSKSPNSMFVMCYHVRLEKLNQIIRHTANNFNLWCAELSGDDLPTACSDILSNNPLQLLTFSPKDADIII